MSTHFFTSFKLLKISFVRTEITLRHYCLLYIYHFSLLFSMENVLWYDFRYAIADHRSLKYSSSRGYPMSFKKITHELANVYIRKLNYNKLYAYA